MNMMKKLTLVLVIGILMIAAGAVAAQQGQGGQGQGGHGPYGDNGQNRSGFAPINFDLATRVIVTAGIDPVAAQQQLQAGVKLIDILAANNVNMDALNANLTASVNALFNDAVASGRMTPERAAERMAHMLARLQRMGVCLTSA